jgi:hypothetical protein
LDMTDMIETALSRGVIFGMGAGGAIEGGRA